MAKEVFVQNEARRSLVAFATKAGTQRSAGRKDPAKTLRYLVYNVLRFEKEKILSEIHFKGIGRRGLRAWTKVSKGWTKIASGGKSYTKAWKTYTCKKNKLV